MVATVMFQKDAQDTRVGTPSRLIVNEVFELLVSSVRQSDPAFGRIDAIACNGTVSTKIECHFVGQKKVKAVLDMYKPVPEFVLVARRTRGEKVELIFTMGLPDLVTDSEIQKIKATFSHPTLEQE